MEATEEVGNSPGVRGGPIYLPNMVGPLTSVHAFQSSACGQLQDLEAELFSESSSVSDHNDISVDDLKVFTEEELVDMALKEAFKDEGNSRDNSKAPSGENSAAREGVKLKYSRETQTNLEAQFESLNENPSGCLLKKRNAKPRIRGQMTKHPSDEAYIAKVQCLAKLKEKQEEEKLSTRLHSLKAIYKSNEVATTSSLERTERMKSLRSTHYEAKLQKSSNNQETAPVLFPEVVLCVEIYHNRSKWTKTQEFLVLGNQLLTELRDQIYCLTDLVMRKAGQHNPSGYFLIEDFFCNDMRDPSAVDYSQPILYWLQNSKEEALGKWECILTGELQRKQKAVLGEVKPMDLPEFRAVDMHKIRFCNLRFRLGAGYLYCHQGDCKHTIVIRDMRLIHPEDIRDRAVYPRIVFQLKHRIQKCDVCKIYRATKFAADDKWARENPCYFCDYCFSLLHSEEGPLNSDYRVYEYLHD